MRVTFSTLGGEDACDPGHGKAQRGLVDVDRRLNTAGGLHIGDSRRRLPHIYPSVPRTSRGFRLVSGLTPFGGPTRRNTVLGARVRGGRVRAFRPYTGAAGE
jgi:hypothetical protein